MNASSKALTAFCAFVVLSFLLPSGGGEPLSLSSLHFGAPAMAGTETANVNDEDFAEPFSDGRKAESAPDPLERLNRMTFQVNDKLYFWFLKPISQIYGTFIPPGLRVCIRNGFDNLRFPARFVNNVLQGKFKAAGIETGRFFINSTLGVVGFFEIASRDFCLPPPADEDTGQTLGFYGLKPVMYIVWPVFGPSTIRDSLGLAGDTFLNPLYYIPQDLWTSAGIRAGIIVNNTSLRIGEYEDFKESALDPYTSMRQAYLQNRENEVLK